MSESHRFLDISSIDRFPISYYCDGNGIPIAKPIYDRNQFITRRLQEDSDASHAPVRGLERIVSRKENPGTRIGSTEGDRACVVRNDVTKPVHGNDREDE